MEITRFSRRVVLLTGLLAIAFVSVSCDRSPQAKSAKYIAAGKSYMEKKDPARAILQFRNAVQANPRDPEAYYQLALASLAVGDLRTGVGALRKTIELNPRHSGAQLRLSRLMAETTDPEILKDAQQRLKGVLQDAPDDPTALHALALTELKLGEPEDAMQHLAEASAAAPQNLIIAVTIAQAKLQQKDPNGAEDVLKKAVETSPKSADAHLMLADFYLSQKRAADGEEQLKRALEIDSKSGPALMAMARLQLSTGRKLEAEQSFKRLSGFPGYESVYGLYLAQDGRRDQALQEFEALRKAHPDDRQIRTHLVAAYQGANRVEDAKKILGEVLKKNPDDLDALLQRGELLMAAKEYAQAEADINKVLKLKPDSPEIHYVVAKLNQARGNPNIYRQQLAETLKLNPFLVRVRLESANDLMASNNGKAAIDLLDQAPEAQRSSMPVLVARNWALWSLREWPEMRKGIDRGLAQGTSPELLVQDGFWKLQAGQPEAARRSLEDALALDPGNLNALQALNRTYPPKDAAKAVQVIKTYAARQPKSEPVQNFLGTLLLTQGDRAGARQAFMAAKAAAPDTAQTDLNLAQLDLVEGKTEDARKRLQEMQGSAQGNRAASWLGVLDYVSADHKAALEYFKKAVDANPNDAQALNNLAYELAEYGKRPDEALKYAQTAVELAPGNPGYSDTLGWILYDKGLYGPAIKYLEIAAAKPGNVVWKYHLAMAYAKAGNAALGRTTLEAALKVNNRIPEAKMAQQVVGSPR